MKRICFILLACFVVSCSSGYGNKMSSDKLDVYYEDKKLQDYADKLGRYWTKAGLVGDKKQSLQLTASGDTLEVRIIATPEFVKEPLDVEERQLLSDLRYNLEQVVLKPKKVVIFVCSNDFKPIYQINK